MMASPSRAHQRTNLSHSAFGPGAYLMFAFLAICGLTTIVGTGEIADIAGVLGVFVGTTVSGLVFRKNAKLLQGRERTAWSWIGAGLLTAAAGVLAVAIVFAINGDAPAFGWTDMFFFAAYAMMLAGFAALPHMKGSPKQRSKMVIDGLIGAVSIGAILWVFALSELTRSFEELSPISRTIGAAYPFLDLLVFTVAILVLLRRSAYRFDVRLALFTVGVTAQVLGDIAFLMSARAGSFEEAQPLYVVNLFGLAAFFATACMLKSTPPAREYADRNPPLWTVLAPYIPAVGMLGFLVASALGTSGHELNNVLLVATILVALLVIARQGVAIVENRTYIEQQRDALVSTISHELRTPLTAILGFVEVLGDDGTSFDRSERRGMLDIVQSQAEYMSRIVSDLIMLARGTGGDVHLEIAPVAMTDLIARSIHAAGVSSESTDVSCPTGLVGLVDAARVQQVLVNLLTNAARYGGPQRLVRIEAVDSDLVLEVHDDGEGVPRRFELRVWDRFERGPNRLNSITPGSGIGLAIVEAIATAHEGSVGYRESEELGGACFYVTLPGRATTQKETPVLA